MSRQKNNLGVDLMIVTVFKVILTLLLVFVPRLPRVFLQSEWKEQKEAIVSGESVKPPSDLYHS